MSGTLNLEDILKKAEAIYRQVLACKTLPESIREIMQLPNPSEPVMKNNVDSGSVSDIPNGTVLSTPSTPDRQTLRIPGKAQQEKTVTLSSPSSDTRNAVMTPDDSSIEILPEDQIDMVL